MWWNEISSLFSGESFSNIYVNCGKDDKIFRRIKFKPFSFSHSVRMDVLAYSWVNWTSLFSRQFRPFPSSSFFLVRFAQLLGNSWLKLKGSLATCLSGPRKDVCAAHTLEIGEDVGWLWWVDSWYPTKIFQYLCKHFSLELELKI